MAIHASARARTGASAQTSSSRHCAAKRPEKAHSSEYTSRIRKPKMARTIGYSRFRDSKPSYLLRAYSGATYSNFSLFTGCSRFVTHDAVRFIVVGETTAQDLARSKSAAATI